MRMSRREPAEGRGARRCVFPNRFHDDDGNGQRDIADQFLEGNGGIFTNERCSEAISVG